MPANREGLAPVIGLARLDIINAAPPSRVALESRYDYIAVGTVENAR